MPGKGPLMDELAVEDCVRVDKNTPALSPETAAVLIKRLPNWTIIDHNGIPALSKTYKFTNFNSALSFTNRVGQQAEDQDHHPAILTEWGRVTVTWWTHVVHGLHRNDFIMAARTEAVFQSFFSS